MLVLGRSAVAHSPAMPPEARSRELLDGRRGSWPGGTVHGRCGEERLTRLSFCGRLSTNSCGVSRSGDIEQPLESTPNFRASNVGILLPEALWASAPQVGSQRFLETLGWDSAPYNSGVFRDALEEGMEEGCVLETSNK